jgi:hypothetical protein
MNEENKNIESEQTGGNIAKQIISPEDTIAPQIGEQPLIAFNDLNDNMEVHHHTHPPDSHRDHGNPPAGRAGKNWRSYFWEFLMLFLAVFCGFLAEYQLEHKIERDREKQFIGSLISDLKDDTLIIAKHIASLEKSIILLDSLSILLDSPALAKKNGEAIYYTSRLGNRTSPLVNNSRTFDQLKYSGGFRLISKTETSNRIMNYYAQLPLLRNVEEIFKTENETYKAIASRIIDPAIYRIQTRPDGSVMRIGGNHALLSYDAALLKQMGFYAVQMNGSRRGMIRILQIMKQSAEELLKYLQTTYHLE